MTAAMVVWAFVSTVLFVGAGLVVALTVRRLWFPGWRGSLAVTVVVLVWICWALVLGQALGAVGLLRPTALLLAALVTAAPAVGLNRFAHPSDDRASDSDRTVGAKPIGRHAIRSSPPTEPAAGGWEQLAMTVGTTLLVLVVAALWTARTAIAIRRGINDPDSLGYHLPFMATFAHSGYADQHRLLIPLYPVQFYPANDELLSAIALLFTHSVVFAAVKNLLFSAFALVAAHALGSAYKAGRMAVAATAVVLGFPVMVFSQPGEAVNDALMLLALLGGLAVLAHARDRPAPYVLAFACAGVALGVKFSAIVPAAALAAFALVLLLARVPSHRWRWAAAGLLTSAALGGSWYLRNAITYGNPVPPVHVALGPLHLRSISSVTGALAFSVGGYLIRGRYLDTFAHGSIKSLGPVFFVMAALGVVGTVAGFRSRDGFRRGLSFFAVVALVGYVSTPAGAYGRPDQIPYSFVVNLHYAAPALLAAIVAGALVIGRVRWAWIFPVVGAMAVLAGIRYGAKIAVWSPGIGGRRFVLLLVAALGGTAAVAMWLLPSLRRWSRPAAAATVLVAVVGVAVIAGRFQSTRSTDPVARWAGHAHRATIAAWVGDLANLYGRRAENRVVVVARVADGAAVPVDTCQTWKQAVVDGHFQYTAVIAGTAWARWLGADPAFLVVAHNAATVVFQVVGQPDLGCAGQVNSDADFWLAPGARL